MEFIDLRVFVAIAEFGSATRAALRLGMTQPGVSQHLARLEDEVGGQLFERIGRSLKISDFGALLLGKARQILIDAEQLKYLSSDSVCPVGWLRLGLTDSSTLTVVPKALAEFQKKYFGVHVGIDVHDSVEIEDRLLRGQYDLGLVTADPRKTHPMLDEEILYRDRLDVIVSRKHPLAKSRRVSLEKLAEWPLLMYPRRSRTRHIIDEAFHSKGLFPKHIIDVYFNSAAARLVEVGVGVGILSHSFITGEIHKHRCVHLRIKGDPFHRTISVARRKDAHLSEGARAFYELLKKDAK